MSGAYSQDPSVMRKTILPLIHNTYDLGSTSKFIRTAYIATSIIYTTNPLLIAADTSAASDTKRIDISGAGAFDTTRGAGLRLRGNQDTGVATLSSGNIAGAYVTINSPASNGVIELTTNGQNQWYIGSTGYFTQGVGATGGFIYRATTFEFKADDDSNRLYLCGGSATSSTNGALLYLNGASGPAPGKAALQACDAVAGGTLNLEAQNATGHIDIYAGSSGTVRWSFDSSGGLTGGASGGSVSVATGKGFLALNSKTLATDITGTFGSSPDFTTVNGSRLCIQATNDGNSVAEYWLKTRATDTSADTIVQAGDNILNIGAWAADGTVYRSVAGIIARVVAAAGVNDISSQFEFRVRAAGAASAATALFIQPDRTLQIANVSAAPASTPASSGFLYVESGALKYKGSSGTITTLGNA